jgi:imidazolonepropionase-like amidohydrolase
MRPLFVADATVFCANGALHERAHVVIENGRIAALGPDVRRPSDADVIDAGGRFVMPGLIDAHTHLALPVVPERKEPHPDVPFMAVRAARVMLASGVTCARDVGGNSHADLALKRAIARGDVMGPRMLACGQAIVPTGGHIHYFCAEADGPDEVTKAVRTQIRAGADWIKLMISGGIANIEEQPDELAFSQEEIAAAVAAAKAKGRRVAVHAYPAEAIRIAAELGVASVEHAVDMDERTIEALKRHGTVIVPTHAVYGRLAADPDGRWPQLAPVARRVLERKEAPLRAALEQGVTIAVGTDCGRHYPHDEIVRELELLQRLGMSAEQVLTAVTRTNAELLGVSHMLGTLEPGKLADLLVLPGDPLGDLGALRSIDEIVLGGQRIKPSALRFLAGPLVPFFPPHA